MLRGAFGIGHMVLARQNRNRDDRVTQFEMSLLLAQISTMPKIGPSSICKPIRISDRLTYRALRIPKGSDTSCVTSELLCPAVLLPLSATRNLYLLDSL